MMTIRYEGISEECVEEMVSRLNEIPNIGEWIRLKTITLMSGNYITEIEFKTADDREQTKREIVKIINEVVIENM